MAVRGVRKVVGGNEKYDGAGVRLVRVIGPADVEDFDPFLMLDAFDSRDPKDYIKGFPWHPHRGIETVTYLIHGDIEHGDSLGNKGNILDGCCQWMTAGRGIIHQEMPQAVDRILGTQLWVNLPGKDKMTEPAYRDITPEKVPVVTGEQSEVRILSGQYQGVFGPEQGDYVKTTYLDVTLDPDAQWRLETDPESTVFCYLVQGAAQFGEGTEPVPSHRAALMGEGESLVVRASSEGVRFFLMAGRPLKEPIAWGGPIVMNTQEELRQAFKELDEKSFIR